MEDVQIGWKNGRKKTGVAADCVSTGGCNVQRRLLTKLENDHMRKIGSRVGVEMYSSMRVETQIDVTRTVLCDKTKCEISLKHIIPLIKIRKEVSEKINL